MMAFTKEGQSDPALVAKRDKQYGTDSEERKAYRAQKIDFSKPTSTAADHWEQGDGAHQLQLVKTGFKKRKLGIKLHLLGSAGIVLPCTVCVCHISTAPFVITSPNTVCVVTT